MINFFNRITNFFMTGIGVFIHIFACALPMVFINPNIIVWFIIFFVISFVPIIGDFLDMILWWVGLYFAVTGSQVILTYIYYLVFGIWFLFIFRPLVVCIITSLFKYES